LLTNVSSINHHSLKKGTPIFGPRDYYSPRFFSTSIPRPDRRGLAARDYVLFMPRTANLTSINVRQICGACVSPAIFVVNFYVWRSVDVWFWDADSVSVSVWLKVFVRFQLTIVGGDVLHFVILFAALLSSAWRLAKSEMAVHLRSSPVAKSWNAITKRSRRCICWPGGRKEAAQG